VGGCVPGPLVGWLAGRLVGWLAAGWLGLRHNRRGRLAATRCRLGD